MSNFLFKISIRTLFFTVWGSVNRELSIAPTGPIMKQYHY